jgi:hypothetical protein
MVPDTTLRLKTVLKALDDIITPAIPQDADFAHEQLGLIKASLGLVIDQIPFEYAFMVQDARDHLALADKLSTFIAGDEASKARLLQASGDVRATLPAVPPAVPRLGRRLRDLKQVLEDAVDELCARRQGEELCAIERIVLDHSAARTIMERSWTIATGFETDPDAIPPIRELLDRGEERVG